MKKLIIKRSCFAVMASVALLTVGCSSGQGNTTIEELGTKVFTTAAAETEESPGASASEEAEKESVEAAEESLKAREESLAVREESLAAREKALQEKEKSLQTAETAGGNGQVPTVNSYSAMTAAPDNYKGKVMVFTGSVVQVAALNDTSMQLLMAVDGNDAARLVGEYPAGLLPFNLNHGDIVTVTGQFVGIMHYRMGSGQRVDLPSLQISSVVRDQAAVTPETTAAAGGTTVPESGAPQTETQAAGSETAAPSQPAGPGSAQGPGSAAAPGPGSAQTETQAAGSETAAPSQPAGPGSAQGPGSTAAPGPGMAATEAAPGPGYQ